MYQNFKRLWHMSDLWKGHMVVFPVYFCMNNYYHGHINTK